MPSPACSPAGTPPDWAALAQVPPVRGRHRPLTSNLSTIPAGTPTAQGRRTRTMLIPVAGTTPVEAAGIRRVAGAAGISPAAAPTTAAVGTPAVRRTTRSEPAR